MAIDLDNLEQTTNTLNIETEMKKSKTSQKKKKDEKVVVRKNAVFSIDVDHLECLSLLKMKLGKNQYEIVEIALKDFFAKKENKALIDRFID